MLTELANYITFHLLQLAPESAAGHAVQFFVYDTAKILLLLVGIVFIMGIINAYFPVDRLRIYLSNNKLYGLEYFLASAFGAITPFCSCSSVPLFIGFVKGGIPLGVTFAYLITSPLVNEVAIALFAGLFGWKITVIYVSSGILLGMTAGFILGKLNLENYLTDWVRAIQQNAIREEAAFEEAHVPFRDRLPVIAKDAWGIIKGVLPYVLIGIAIGAVMHGYVPQGFFERYLSADNIWAVPLSVILAVPLYSSASGILPVIQVLVAKGIPLGTAIAFMMAVVGLSFPEAMLLKKVMSMKLILTFFGVVTLCIIFSGYIFNIILV
ncbi:MAG: permease [Calditrichaeota bacterium]|nr:MAG: permease [Calditrichota bacterium]